MIPITTATFKVWKSVDYPLGPTVDGIVIYLGTTATFTPLGDLEPDIEYTAEIMPAATDLAFNPLVSGPVPNEWTFTTGTDPSSGIDLGSASTFGIMAFSAITDALPYDSVVRDGDVAIDPGESCDLTPAQVPEGSIHKNDAVSEQVKIDLLAAYNIAWAMPADETPGTVNLGAYNSALNPLGPGRLPAGVYYSGSTMNVNTNLTLDAEGDPAAVWVFHVGSSLTTTTGSVLLDNSAQAKNVFWVVDQSATIGVNTIFNGNILAGLSITANTGSTIYGRLLGGTGGGGTIALQSATIWVPAP